MRYQALTSVATVAVAVNAASSNTSTLADICDVAKVQAALPANGFISGITLEPSSVTTNAVYNAAANGSDFYPPSTVSYCNVTFAYTHNGLGDTVLVQYYLPSPSDFTNRYLSNGGGAYEVYSGEAALLGGTIYGAVSGATDGGFGSFGVSYDDIMLLANGTLNLHITQMFGFQAHYELATLGKEFTRLLYDVQNSTKIYSYYQACSEGGREGWSQVQRYHDEFDGAIIGAPAFRFSFQQTQHLYSAVAEKTLGYFPPPCELEKIVNLTIAACDSLDGKVDGVIARSDLCQIEFDLKSTIGEAYYCAASSGGGFGPAKRQEGGSTTPAQNGTVTAKGVEVAQAIIDGLHDSEGRLAYLSYRIGAEFSDGETSYDSTTDSWTQVAGGVGGEYVEKFLYLQNGSSLPSLDAISYDDLKAWMEQGLQMYDDVLQTTWPDLGPYRNAGNKVLHFHGESDPSVPTGSSVHYYEAVRSTLYPGMSFNESQAELNKWYKLFMIPGMAHCAVNDLQPNGPFPQTNLQVMIDWVEHGIEPVTLNATILQGEYEGTNEQICAWPLRPLWTSNTTNPNCVYSQPSIDNWIQPFTAFDIPIY